MRMRQRAVGALAAGAALSLVGATAASAHHCYKVDWQDQAHEQLARAGTPWLPLSDLGTMVFVDPAMVGECGPVVDEVVQEWTQAAGLSAEPLIHSRATVGGGAFYGKGKVPQPFGYLSEEDFMALGETLVPRLAALGCLAPMEE